MGWISFGLKTKSCRAFSGRDSNTLYSNKQHFVKGQLYAIRLDPDCEIRWAEFISSYSGILPQEACFPRLSEYGSQIVI